jgi:hypothetical protein
LQNNLSLNPPAFDAVNGQSMQFDYEVTPEESALCSFRLGNLLGIIAQAHTAEVGHDAVAVIASAIARPPR